MHLRWLAAMSLPATVSFSGFGELWSMIRKPMAMAMAMADDMNLS